MDKAGSGKFWMWSSGLSDSNWHIEIVGIGTPQPPTGLPGLHQAVTVHGTPAQPQVSYTVTLDQAWTGLEWSSGPFKGDYPVQFRFTMTTTGSVPLTSDSPSQDPTLVAKSMTGTWQGKATYTSGAYQCPANLPPFVTLLNPHRSLTGCVTFNLPPKFAFWLQSPTTRVVWQPDGVLNSDQKSYAWQPWPA
jgi:hypothetical protein